MREQLMSNGRILITGDLNDDEALFRELNEVFEESRTTRRVIGKVAYNAFVEHLHIGTSWSATLLITGEPEPQ